MHNDKETVLKYLCNNKIKCFKYNYNLDEEVSKYTSYQSFLQFEGEDENLYLNIINRIPVEKLKHELNTNPKDVNEKIIENNLKRYEAMYGDSYRNQEMEHLYTELDEELDDIQFTEKKSNCSCYVSEIQGFIIGGFSSRFWMMRKHIISSDKQFQEKVPFKSWNCITLYMKHREVDLVVKNDKEMDMLLKILILNLKTADGNRDSGLGLLSALYKQAMSHFKHTPTLKQVEKINNRISHQLM